MLLKKFQLLVLLLSFSLYSMAQNQEEKTIREILATQSAAWNKGDIEGFMKGYWESDSLTFIGKKGVTYGWKNTLSNYRKSYPDTKAMGKLKFTIIAVNALSPIYQQVIGKWQLKRSAGDLEGHFTLLFKKIGNDWVIIADHSS
jgi:ketosteroid isomerase-like protein